jgi:threonine/homoserine/homoserine lactone efflux protein
MGTFGAVFGPGLDSKIILVFLSIILCLPAILSWTVFGTVLRRIFSTPESSVLLNRFLGFSLFLVSVWLVYY